MKKTGVVALILILVFVAWWIGRPADSDVPKVVIYNLLSHPILDQSIEGIKEGLRSEGYGDKEVRFIELNANAEMDKLSAFAREALAVQPDVIVPVSTPVTQAVFKESPPTQAIVYSTVTNPSDVGMDGSPKNMTGVSDVVNYEANLDLIRELLPDVRRLGIIYNAGEANSEFGVREIEKLAPARGFTINLVAISRSDEVDEAARGLLGEVDCFYVGSDNTVVSAMAALTKVAYEAKIPVIASDVGSVESGAVAAISVDYRELGKEAGRLVAEVLRSGEAPGSIQRVMYLGQSLVVNLKSAERLGLEIPEKLQAKAHIVGEGGAEK